MNERDRKRLLFAALLLLLLLLALLVRCTRKPVAVAPVSHPPATTPAPAEPVKKEAAPSTPPADEVLTAATLQAPPEINAGATFQVSWTGPDNKGDYVTIVPAGAPDAVFASYEETREGPTLALVAPVEPGEHEVRYVTAHSRTVLGRAPVRVVAVGATLDAANEIELGKALRVAWTGPDEPGDYITLVPAGTPDDQYRNYTNTEKGSPLEILVPPEAGDFELRYATGQGHKVLARRSVRVIAPELSLDAPGSAIAGTTIQVAWRGPDNSGDYITVVARETPEGQYGNYTTTDKGSPLELLIPIGEGDFELRYMTGQASKVLARRAIRIEAAKITLSAPEEVAAGSDVSIEWKGPDNPGDWITIVARSAPDGQYGDYKLTSDGSTLVVKAPTSAGDAEIRYMTGQGNQLLARRPIRVVP